MPPAPKPVKKSTRKTAKSPAKSSVKSAPARAAKKATAKPAKKAAARPVKQAVAKPRAAKVAASTDPVPVNTGKGLTPAQVGEALVTMFNMGKVNQIEADFWSPQIVSCEGSANLEWRGRAAVDAKNAWWYGENEMLGGRAEGPYVGATGFAVKFRITARNRQSGVETTMDEVGVYTVNDGRIVREEFMNLVPSRS